MHPLLFADRRGRPRPVDPALIPLACCATTPALARIRLVRTAFGGVRPLLYTSEPKARLRTVEHRGVATAAMVYDALPIIDVFRRVVGRRAARRDGPARAAGAVLLPAASGTTVS